MILVYLTGIMEDSDIPHQYSINRYKDYTMNNVMHVPVHMIPNNTRVNTYYTLVRLKNGAHMLELMGNGKRIPANKKLRVMIGDMT